MHFQTTAEILRASYIPTNIILIDRGLIDSNFYGKKFLWEGVATEEQYKNFRKQFINELFPDFLIALIVPASIAIKRRGGAGHLVNESYISRYNKLFMRYYNELDCKKTIIDTGELDVYEMNDLIFKTILENLP